MPLRAKLLVSLMLLWAVFDSVCAAQAPSNSWVKFAVLLVVVLLSSGLKVALPRGDGTMSLNFPFILLAVVQLSPLQAILIAALSAAAQCRIRVAKLFSVVQIIFNIANAMCATAAALLTYITLSRFHVALAPALGLGAVAYFLSSTIPVALVIAWCNGEPAAVLWKAEFPWFLPFYVVGAFLAALAHMLSKRFGWATSLMLVPVVYTLYRSYEAQRISIKERQQHLEETEALHLRTIEGLAMAIEAKDQKTHDHLFRVRNYVAEVGLALGLSKLELKALQTAAFLHDIGKLAVPEHIINKPGKLSPEEFEKMKIHPTVGADILERVRFPYPVVPIVRSHHEWWNGAGYPDGLKGNEIPIGARVLTVVDCFDALASDRPYRKALPIESAMSHIKGLAGVQFDPKVVEALDQCHLHLEEKAQRSKEKIFTPLNTEVNVWRGAAPGAGFEQDHQRVVVDPVIGDSSGGWTTAPSAAITSLNLIAAASQEAQGLFEMSQSLGNSLSLNETVSVMASRLHKLISFDSCALYLKVNDTLILKYVDGLEANSFSRLPITIGDGISGWVALSGKAIVNGNAAMEAGYVSEGAQAGGLRAALSIPLFDLQTEILGVLTLYATSAESFSRDHLRILQAMESKLSLSLQNALHLCRVETDAETDYLTGLPNARRLFLQLETELEKCRSTGSCLAVVVCDLNSFKEVNDHRGHLLGDLLLTSISGAFRKNSPQMDTVARMGGDEFVFLIPHLDKEDAGERLASIAAIVNTVCLAPPLRVEVSASLGASFYPTDGETAEDLLAVADRRMYQDKKAHYKSSGRADSRPPNRGAAA
jgi:diguanylate cyclase (GGDEF)-like protein/putative nucleotidyltransferase with HDIG domain